MGRILVKSVSVLLETSVSETRRVRTQERTGSKARMAKMVHSNGTRARSPEKMICASVKTRTAESQAIEESSASPRLGLRGSCMSMTALEEQCSDE